ncbi:MAG: hypothetical protein Q7K03_03035 [Dehalococcoidia bacterium]|nr:hypothetical protein [Dehalococcoidia bacterium]
MNQEHQEIRDIQLLRDEEVWGELHPGLGLLEEVPERGDCVVLTNQRLLGFWQEQGRHRRILLPLETVDGVELSGTVRSMKPLMQGALLLLAAVAVVWLALAFDELGFLSWLIVATIVVLAAVTASSFWASEQIATITFRAGTLEVTLPLQTPQAQRDAHTLALMFFQARAGQERSPSPLSPAVEPVPWPVTPEPGPMETGQRGDSSSAETPVHSVESTQTEGRHDI